MKKIQQERPQAYCQNPFTSSSAGDPWQGKYPYVESINGSVMTALLQLIEQVRENPRYNCAALILGEAGSGKTDLLGRLLEKSRLPHVPFSFAYIQPFEDTQRPFQYLLRELMVSLSYKIRNGETQLDTIVGRLYRETLLKRTKINAPPAQLKRFKEQLQADPGIIFRKAYFSAASFSKLEQRTLKELRQRFPDISKTFFKVLLQYRYPERRPAVLEWLKGNIVDREDAAVLRIRDIFDDSTEYQEQRARELITFLGKVIAPNQTPIAICFDRLENMTSPKQITALGKIIQFLIDVVPSVLPIVCARGDGWVERFRQQLNHHVVSRLEGNYFELHGCSPQQSLEMIKSRLDHIRPAPAENPFFPFEKETLNQLYHGKILSPRRVLSLANREMNRLLGAEPITARTALEKIKAAFDAQRHDILEAPYQFQPDRFRLRLGLRLLLKQLFQNQSVQVTQLKTDTRSKYEDLEFRLQQQKRLTPAYLLIDTALHHSACGAAIRTGLKILEQQPGAKTIYLREYRTPIPKKWQRTQGYLQTFQKQGGAYVTLSQEESASLYTLALLNYAVKEGDLTIEDNQSGFRAITEEELDHFIEQVILADNERLKTLSQNLKSYLAET